MIISITAVKASEKLQPPFMIKTLKKLAIEENVLNKIKAIYQKTTDYIILNGERLEAFPLRSKKRQEHLSALTFLQHCTKSSSQGN